MVLAAFPTSFGSATGVRVEVVGKVRYPSACVCACARGDGAVSTVPPFCYPAGVGGAGR